ncbi:hypothetical protein RSOLAG1IB_07344 [Rhizoctonia solani AG-1 IB]|uniref:CCL2-like lectin domain-containing protein n=1 Tax=Thanatephorus cucumeris (strain AG1-IB / isolate 7/3/14) TaxID=1108050 RepID=M5C7G6_THACB|nr:hypothetical protein BN14_05852 [Rhizoctonia solani AG-1 IB]CEL54810.1 hypothetical protein RSOLAG1IB_07344 [Rhizoctonia solani AG-1 IB]
MPELYPSNGTYIIYNRVLSPNGKQLAMTFNGNGQSITATPLNAQDTKQQWVVQRYGPGRTGGSVYEIKPVENRNLEAGGSNNGTIVTIPVGSYVFSIYQHDTGYLIKNGDRRYPWALSPAAGGSSVIASSDSADEKQRWWFQPV